MHIAGFVLFSIFAAIAFFLARLMWKPSPPKRKDCHTATATVKNTITNHDSDGDYAGYKYVVNFIDYNGNEAVGTSEAFLEKRALQDERTAEVCYWQREQTEVGRELEQFVHGVANGMTKTLFNKEYEPDPRPQYEIHFCDERVYSLERRSEKRSATICFLFGCAMVVLAVVILCRG